MRHARAVQQFQHRRRAAVLPGGTSNIDIIGAGVFEGEADKFATALNLRPVIQLVAHACASKSAYRHVVLLLVSIAPQRREGKRRDTSIKKARREAGLMSCMLRTSGLLDRREHPAAATLAPEGPYFGDFLRLGRAFHHLAGGAV